MLVIDKILDQLRSGGCVILVRLIGDAGHLGNQFVSLGRNPDQFNFYSLPPVANKSERMIVPRATKLLGR